MKTIKVTKTEDLNEFATLLLSNGYDIISSYNKEDPGNSFNTYFHFHKDGFFGYCQKERFEGFGLSTVNKPCKKFGTGHGFLKSWDCLTLEKAEECLKFAKRLINNKEEIKNYNSVNEFLEKSFSKKELIKHKS